MVDIIIPAYNAHDTIGRTLASIAMQTCRPHLKVYIVDDASENSYDEITALWSELLDIELIRLSENSGPGVARQAGLDASLNIYTAFIDADDTFVCANCIETLVSEIQSGNYDIVYGSFLEQLCDGRLISHCENMTWLFGKLYKREFIDRFNIRFNNSRANEDTSFNGIAAALTKAVKFIPTPVYLWHFNPLSITRADDLSYSLYEGFRGYVENSIHVIRELMKHGIGSEKLKLEAVAGLCGIYFTVIENLHRSPMDKPRWLLEAKEYYDEIYTIFEPYISKEFFDSVYLAVRRTRLDVLEFIVPELSITEFCSTLKECAEV